MRNPLPALWSRFQKDKWLGAALIAALGALVYVIGNLWGIRFTHFDDTNFLLASENWPNFGLASNVATGQGRVQFFLGIPLMLFALKFNYMPIFDILHFGSAGLFWGSFALLVGLNLGARYGILTAAALFGTIVLIWEHTTITSAPMWFFFIFTIGFIAVIFLKIYFNTRRNLYLLIATALLFIGSWMQEFTAMVLLWLWLGTCLCEYMRYTENGGRKKLATYLYDIRKPLLYGLLAVGAFAACYYGYRIFHPAQYDAMKVFEDLSASHGFKPWSFVWFIKTAWQFSISSQILYWLQAGYEFPYLYAAAMPDTAEYAFKIWPLESWCALLQFKYIAFSALIFIASFGALYKSDGLARRNLVFVLLFALVLMFIPNAVVALSIRYQNWARQGIEAYAYTHFAIIGFSLTLATILMLLLSFFPKGRARKIGAAFGALFLAFCALCASYQNDKVAHSMRLNAERMYLAKSAIGAEALRSYFDNKTIYAPDLFRYIWSPTVPSSERWFNDYAMQKGMVSRFITQTSKYAAQPESYLGLLPAQECENYYGVVGDIKTSPAGLVLNKGKIIASRLPENFFASWTDRNLQRHMVVSEFTRAARGVYLAALPDGVILNGLTAGCVPPVVAPVKFSEVMIDKKITLPAIVDFTTEPLTDGARLYSGWANTEWTFRWNNGKKAVFLLNLDPVIGRDVSAKLEGGPFLNGTTVKEQPVAISINGVPVGRWVLREGGPGVFTDMKFTIPRRLLREQPLAVTIEIPNSQIPGPGDPRALGLAVGKLHLSASPD